MKEYERIYIILNFAIPLLVGAIIYYFLSPDVIFVKVIDEIFGCGVHFASLLEKNFVVRFVRFYLLDMLWGYALVFALYFVFGNNTAKLKGIFYIAFVFSISMEVLQLTSLAEGTFDFIDILFEFLAEVFAVFIIKNTHEEALK